MKKFLLTVVVAVCSISYASAHITLKVYGKFRQKFISLQNLKFCNKNALATI